MSWGFALLFVAASAIVAYGVSAIVALMLVPIERLLTNVDARGFT